ncbi:MAG: hypothetical protein FJ276_20870 [Planctomycetes bacterium]|nr:hypothetical protein [Planctomycetota bacterium]
MFRPEDSIDTALPANQVQKALTEKSPQFAQTNTAHGRVRTEDGYSCASRNTWTGKSARPEYTWTGKSARPEILGRAGVPVPNILGRAGVPVPNILGRARVPVPKCLDGQECPSYNWRG